MTNPNDIGARKNVYFPTQKELDEALEKAAIVAERLGLNPDRSFSWLVRHLLRTADIDDYRLPG